MGPIYRQLQERLARGWNTWDTRSVLSHVLLPQGFAFRLGVKEMSDGYRLSEALIGRENRTGEQVLPGTRTFNGRYTSCEVRWRSIDLLVESCSLSTDGESPIPTLVVRVTPLRVQRVTSYLTVEGGFIWGYPGLTEQRNGALIGTVGTVGPLGTVAAPESPDVVGLQQAHIADTGPMHRITVFPVNSVHDTTIALATLAPYLTLPLTQPIVLVAGPVEAQHRVPQTVEQADGRLESAREKAATVVLNGQEYVQAGKEPSDTTEVLEAVQRALSWNTVFDPTGKRVISPVSRVWNTIWGGHVLFCWDTYFAAYTAGLFDRDLAYANAVEITRAITDRGFVPNFAGATITSLDRSQPPIGSFVLLQLYQWYGDRWVLDETFDALLRWNRWWPENRATALKGLLGWGSTPYKPHTDNELETMGVGGSEGAAYESGLDNSPMYDGVPFDTERNTMALADVGLNSLYVLDCESLAEIATILGRDQETQELSDRAQTYRSRIGLLWDEDRQVFSNRFTGDLSGGPDGVGFSPRLSPTSFYPLLAGAASESQATALVRDHLLNPDEFAGRWMIPATPRNDPAYADQEYWRGRIWAPMNFLVYLGLRRYGMNEAMDELASSSGELLLKEWREHGHVHENYNADTGEGCDVEWSDRYYHWGGLLGVTYLMNRGTVPGPGFAGSKNTEATRA